MGRALGEDKNCQSGAFKLKLFLLQILLIFCAKSSSSCWPSTGGSAKRYEVRSKEETGLIWRQVSQF